MVLLIDFANHRELGIGASNEWPLLVRFADGNQGILICRERFAVGTFHRVRPTLSEA